jgi:hypothetical protein
VRDGEARQRGAEELDRGGRTEKHDDEGRETSTTAGQGVKDMAARAAGATADYASAKDTGAQAATEKTQEAMGTTADYTKQAAAKVKDVTASTAGTTMKYAKQAAVKRPRT